MPSSNGRTNTGSHRDTDGPAPSLPPSVNNNTHLSIIGIASLGLLASGAGGLLGNWRGEDVAWRAEQKRLREVKQRRRDQKRAEEDRT